MTSKFSFHRLFLGVLLLTGCVGLAHAEVTVERLANDFPKDNPDKIEVIEFFSYGCGHCNDFHPILTKWAKAQAADVSFRRVPVAWSRQWAGLSRLFYTLEALGELKRLDNAVFEAIHKERRNDLVTEKGATSWYVGKGGNAKKFADAYKSFGVMSKVTQSEHMAQKMEIESVPTLIVDGHKIQGEFGEVLKAADQLIANARKK